MDDMFQEDRWYGARYAASAGDDLYLVAGRILSDLKADQRADRLPPSGVIVVAAGANLITVQVHVQDPVDFEKVGATSARAQVNRVMERYNWIGKANRADVRYRTSVQIRTVTSRLDANDLGTLLG